MRADTLKTVADIPGVSWITRASWAVSIGLVASNLSLPITRNCTDPALAPFIRKRLRGPAMRIPAEADQYSWMKAITIPV
jgi:hypothetical protein